MFPTKSIAALLLLCCAHSYANNSETDSNVIADGVISTEGVMSGVGASNPGSSGSDVSSPIVSKNSLTEIVVVSSQTANEQPASGYTTVATALRFNPSVELQSRGLAEGQSDVTVRGSIFENTGFKLGAVTILDPQTGHYVADIPISVNMLGAPTIATDIDAAVEGFNASIATIGYSLKEIESGGAAELGFGSDNLNFQSINHFDAFTNTAGNRVGFGVALARSEGDGSVPNGDHEFEQASFQIQHKSEKVQTDFMVSYQDKFFGWPGAYTGFENFAEVDETQTTLVLANQRRETDDGWLELGGYYRRLSNNYDFDRTTFETGAPGSFEHETQVTGLGFRGAKETQMLVWRYAGQIAKSELIRSTDLTGGTFNQLTYGTFSIVPSAQFKLNNGDRVEWRAGANFDYSNRNKDQVSPLLGISLERDNQNSTTEYALEYAETSQLPGYTAIKSNASGLFGGNPDLGRENAKQLSAVLRFKATNWQATATVFGRQDDNLVDWTYSSNSPFSRQANPVDIDVKGLELVALRQWQNIEVVVSHTRLDKDSDYGEAQVDASFYALNFAKHRTTLALTYRLPYGLALKIDSEYRSQELNPLRQGDSSSFLASASLGWTSSDGKLATNLVIDNATDSTYQPFPGTPASGRQIGLSASYHW